MRRIAIVLTVAAMMAVVTVVLAAPAFAVAAHPCPFCPDLEANNAAQGDFLTGSTHAVPNSDSQADNGLPKALMQNATP